MNFRPGFSNIWEPQEKIGSTGVKIGTVGPTANPTYEFPKTEEVTVLTTLPPHHLGRHRAVNAELRRAAHRDAGVQVAAQ